MAATVILSGLVALSLLASAHAEPLPDPTRPPDAVLAPAADAGDAARPSAGLVLQSILIAPDRRSAVISGQSMVVGDMVSGLRLSRVAAGEVTLEGAEGSRTLTLYPDVSIRKSRGTDEPATRVRRHGKR